MNFCQLDEFVYRSGRKYEIDEMRHENKNDKKLNKNDKKLISYYNLIIFAAFKAVETIFSISIFFSSLKIKS